ncbi:unnamed protein product [Closterium sp. Yama58-4]|nr:unnamed protein product [Closterium sp. Yama58-4]
MFSIATFRVGFSRQVSPRVLPHPFSMAFAAHVSYLPSGAPFPSYLSILSRDCSSPIRPFLLFPPLVANLQQAATPVTITVGAAVASYFLADAFVGGSESRSQGGNVASSMSGWSAIEYRRMPIAEYLKILSGWEEVNGVADDRSQRALLKRLADAPSTTAV